MPNYIHRTDGNSGSYPYGKTYLTSVSPQDLPENEANDIQDPDLSAVDGFDSIYWNISGDSVLLANGGTRNARDADIAAQQVLQQNQSQKDSYTNNEIFRAQIKYVVDEINILRQNAGLTPARTYADAQTFMFDAIDNGEV